MSRVFSATVVHGTNDSVDEPFRPKVAAFGLKKIFDLYYVLVNGKYISDTSGHFGLQRQSERSYSTAGIAQQIVVELRAIILPTVTEIWDSKLLEKLPEGTVKRLLDVLKMIASGDHEPSQAQSDKVSDVPSKHLYLFEFLTA